VLVCDGVNVGVNVAVFDDVGVGVPVLEGVGVGVEEHDDTLSSELDGYVELLSEPDTSPAYGN